MIEWGLYGYSASGAGVFLAEHHSKLGSYYGDVNGNEWPHTPLHKRPTSLEEDFNKLLTNITFVMSNGTLENVSILDLPAFGSTIVTLKRGLKKQFIWPIKTNFALQKSTTVQNRSAILTSYKTLTESDNESNCFNLEKKVELFWTYSGGERE